MGKRMGGDGRVGPMGGRVRSVGGRSGVGGGGHIYNRPEGFGLGRGGVDGRGRGRKGRVVGGGGGRRERGVRVIHLGLSYKSECAFDR